jgi:hypothetical protein
MSKARWALPETVQATLERSGVPWEVRNGTRHLKLFIRGKMVAVLPRLHGRTKAWQNHTGNLEASVRRALRGQP